MNRKSIQQLIDGLGEGGLRLVLEDNAQVVSGARAIADDMVEIYPADDPDRQAYRVEVSKVSKVGDGLQLDGPFVLDCRLYPIGDADASGVLSIKPAPEEDQ